MRWTLLTLLLVGCDAVSVLSAGDADVTVSILDAEYQAKQRSTPDLPDQLGPQQPAQPQLTAAKPNAVLITANFYCPPCENWKSRLPELPFNTSVEVRSVSPTGSFPCLWYPNTSTKSGWSYYSGNLDAFIRNYDTSARVLREAPKEDPPEPPVVKRKVLKQVRVCDNRGRCYLVNQWVEE